MLDKIRDCLKRALKLDDQAAAEISDQTTAGDLSGWTSIAHLTLVLELEKAFGVAFDDDEIVEMGSVASIADRLTAKGVA